MIQLSVPLLLVYLISIILLIQVCNCEEGEQQHDNEQSVHLISGVDLPLLGFGIGNLPHESIPHVVQAQLEEGVRLIDTARASNNEKILADAIAMFDGAHSNTRGGSSGAGSTDDPGIIHVITKVWYTHLGYGRTKLSVQESLRDLQSSTTHQIYVHVLLHWPKCDDSIPWMNCKEEEENLPQYVKDAGHNPLENKDTAFLGSWKALEDIFMDHQKLMEEHKKSKQVMNPIIASIGVSNFELDDMKFLLLGPHTRVSPHIYQGPSWKTYHDPYMLDLLHKNNIHFQAYGVMNGILGMRNQAPNAFYVLTDISRELAATVHSEQKDVVVTEATVLLAHLQLDKIGLIPRAASPYHQKENSPQAIAAIIPHLTPVHRQQLNLAIPALMKGDDLVSTIHFTNGLESPVSIHWINPSDKEEVIVSDLIHPGNTETQQSHPGHKFVAYGPGKKVRKEFVVNALYGEEEHFKIEL